MKKSNLLFAMSACAMLVTSCASEQEMPDAPVNNGEGKQIITLSVNNQDGTRAGRPLLSSEAAQNIENVKVIITNVENTVVWTYNFTEWNTTGKEYTNGLYDDLEIKKEDYNFVEEAEALKNKLLENGNDALAAKAANYTVYAIGWSEDTDYDLDAVKDLTVNAEFTEDLVISYKEGKQSNGNWAEEIFAGSQTFTAANTIKANVVLNRQVAGTYGYLREIPYLTSGEGETLKVGRYLHLIASDYNSDLVLGHFANDDHANNAGSKFVINGLKNKESNTGKIVYTIDLQKWFTQLVPLTKEDNTVILDYAKWVNPTDATPEPIHYRKGSVFGASFIHPFAKTADSTFTLVLTTDEEAQNVLQSWTVILTDNSQINAHSVWSFDGAWNESKNVEDNYKNYSILRNNLYSIGARPKAEPKDPKDPTDPDPEPDPDPNDPDDPTPLNNKQQLVIKVNSNWEAMHEMGLM